MRGKDCEGVKSSFDNIAKYHLNNSEIARELYCDGLTEGDNKKCSIRILADEEYLRIVDAIEEME